MGQTPVPPVNIPIPTKKWVVNAPTPKYPIGFDPQNRVTAKRAADKFVSQAKGLACGSAMDTISCASDVANGREGLEAAQRKSLKAILLSGRSGFLWPSFPVFMANLIGEYTIQILTSVLKHRKLRTWPTINRSQLILRKGHRDILFSLQSGTGFHVSKEPPMMERVGE